MTRGFHESTAVALAPVEACAAVHDALARLPRHERPADVRISDGLYFFLEDGESSPHSTTGRVVRVGNHPRSAGTLVRRLSQHYTGDKNGGVFRRALGGALLRRADPQSPCLLPGPGAGHWERGKEPTCARCAPTEPAVSDLLRTRFRVQVVAVPDLDRRNRLEALLVATLAACRACGPSATWLGSQAHSPAMRRAGLWNVEFVGGPTFGRGDLTDFEDLVAATPPVTATRTSRIPKRPGQPQPSIDPARTLIVIPCSSGKEPGTDMAGAGAPIGIERVIGLVARSGDYRVVLTQTAWPATVRSAEILMPTHRHGVDPREATPRVMGSAHAAQLDSGADLSTWRDPVSGSWLERDPAGRRAADASPPKPPSPPAAGVSASALAEVRAALGRYEDEVAAAPLAPAMRRICLLHATNFVRWLEGRFAPGSGVDR